MIINSIAHLDISPNPLKKSNCLTGGHKNRPRSNGKWLEGNLAKNRRYKVTILTYYLKKVIAQYGQSLLFVKEVNVDISTRKSVQHLFLKSRANG